MNAQQQKQSCNTNSTSCNWTDFMHKMQHCCDFNNMRHEVAKNMETGMQLLQRGVKNTQDLWQKNMEIGKQNLQNNMSNAKEMMSCRNPQDFQQNAAAFTQSWAKEASDYMRDMVDFYTQCGMDMMNIANSRMSEALASLKQK